MLISHVRNNRRLISLTRTAQVEQAVRLMKDEGVGAVVILDASGGLEGIFAERDVVTALARGGAAILRDPVSRWMRSDAPTASPQTSILDATRLISDARARHLPVVQEGKVVGLLSVGDLVKSRLDEKTTENLVLQEMAGWPRPSMA